MDDLGPGMPPKRTAPPAKRKSRLGTHRLSAGNVLSRTFSVYGRYFVPFVLFSLLLHAPIALWLMSALNPEAFAGAEAEEVAARLDRIDWIVITLGAIVPILIQTVVTYATFQSLSGNRASIGESLRVGLSRLVPAIGVAFVLALVLGAVVIVPALLSLALLTPALIVALLIYLAYFIAVQVCVVEKAGVGASLTRSAALTKGSRFSIFVALFVFFLISVVVTIIAVLGFGLSITETELLNVEDLRTRELIELAIGAVVAPLSAVCAAVIYHDLRTGKEGVGAEELARVFE